MTNAHNAALTTSYTLGEQACLQEIIVPKVVWCVQNLELQNAYASICMLFNPKTGLSFAACHLKRRLRR